MTTESPLRIEPDRDGAVERWTVDRPRAKNALSARTMAALRDALDGLVGRSPGPRAIVLTGARGVFVSGGDLVELRGKSTATDAENLSKAGFDLLAKIEAAAIPVIAALDGAALGGGAELALACDLRIASRSAVFGFRQVRMAVCTAWGTTARLVATVGPSRAFSLLATGRDVPAEEALRLGLVDEIADDPALRATEIAKAIAAHDPGAVAANKALVVRARRSLVNELRSDELALFKKTWSSQAHDDAVERFFERPR